MAASGFCVLLLIGLFSAGSALDCYICDGFTDKRCNNNPFEPVEEFKSNCSADVCYKISIYNPQYKEVILRSCGFVSWEKVAEPYNLTKFSSEWDIDQPMQLSYYSVITASCLRDLCNYSAYLRGSFTLTGLLVGVSMLLAPRMLR